jgi:hypothetical protein
VCPRSSARDTSRKLAASSKAFAESTPAQVMVAKRRRADALARCVIDGDSRQNRGTGRLAEATPFAAAGQREVLIRGITIGQAPAFWRSYSCGQILWRHMAARLVISLAGPSVIRSLATAIQALAVFQHESLVGVAPSYQTIGSSTPLPCTHLHPSVPVSLYSATGRSRDHARTGGELWRCVHRGAML